MRFLTLLCIAPLIGACQTIDTTVYKETAKASWYQHGTQTASGQKFDPNGYTAAHKSLPFGTKLKLTNTINGKVIFVTVNDRGPFIRGREIDVSKGGAKALGFIDSGTANLKMEIIK